MGPMKNLDIITHTSIIIFITIIIIINTFQILFQHSGKLTHSVKRTKPQALLPNCIYKFHPNSGVKGKYQAQEYSITRPI